MPQFSIKIVGVSIMVRHYALSSATSNTLGNIQVKNSLKSTLASTALTQVSHQRHNMCTNCHPRSSGDWSCCGWQKEINPVV